MKAQSKCDIAFHGIPVLMSRATQKVVCIPHANSGCSDSNNMQYLDKRPQNIPNILISEVMQNISRDSKMSSK